MPLISPQLGMYASLKREHPSLKFGMLNFTLIFLVSSMCPKMTNVLTGLLGFLLITAVVEVSADEAITIFLDGGKEFSAIKTDVDAIRIAGNELNTE